MPALSSSKVFASVAINLLLMNNDMGWNTTHFIFAVTSFFNGPIWNSRITAIRFMQKKALETSG